MVEIAENLAIGLFDVQMMASLETLPETIAAISMDLSSSIDAQVRSGCPS